jgi:hypothetical protein
MMGLLVIRHYERVENFACSITNSIPYISVYTYVHACSLSIISFEPEH